MIGLFLEIVFKQGYQLVDGDLLNEMVEQINLLTEASGSSIASQVTVNVGSTISASLNQIIVFNSASGVPKTVNAPVSTGSLSVIEVIDAFGDAYTNPITFTPISGSVIGSQNQIYTNFGSARWRDTFGGWANV